MPLPLSPPVFTILNSLIRERAGLHYRSEDLPLFRDKLSVRAEQIGFESLLDYYYFLRYDPGGSAELDRLIETMVVHETYFFREADQLQALFDHLLSPKLRRGEQVRIWCAACATGEEPFTLAMLAAQQGVLDQVRILASDVSERVLARARRGEFGLRAARSLPEGIEGRFLSREAGKIVLLPSLAAAIEWRRVNLIDFETVRALGRFDVILARNVLIYFSDETVQSVIGALSDALAPNGYLLVGASESLLRYGTSLACEEHGGAFFYKKVP